MRVAILGLACLAVASLCSAQTYDLKIYAVGAQSPQQSYALGNVQCGQTPPPATASNVNPNRVVWTDPNNATLVCQFVGGPLDPIFTRPIGSYEGTLTVTTDAGTSAESARSPFFVKASPAVLTGLKFIR